MENSVLKDLLKEYERKHIKAQQEADERKNKLFLQYPQLKEIEAELNNYAILTAKSIISSNNNSNAVQELSTTVENLKRKKENILSSLKISTDYLLPHYDCSLCQDTGYINTSYSATMCSCLKQKIYDIEYNKSNISTLSKECFENFDANFYSDEVNNVQYHSDISPRQNILTIKKICKNFIQNFDLPESKNLLFTGNTGLGKTFLSNCIAKELLSSGKTVLYQTSPILLDSIIDCRFDKTNCDKNIIDHIYNVDLLVIDDLGTENLNSIKFTELFNIINTRLLNQHNKITKTIISTNLNLKNLFSIYDERIVSRLIGYYDICRFFGDDIRLKQKNK